MEPGLNEHLDLLGNNKFPKKSYLAQISCLIVSTLDSVGFLSPKMFKNALYQHGIQSKTKTIDYVP